MRPRRCPAFLAAGAAVALAWVGGARGQPGAPRPNLLLVTIDTLRADRIGAYGYAPATTPVLDRLAAEGVRFTDATAHSPLTLPAHAALLTGRYPARYGLRLNGLAALPESAVTVAERLRAAGYRTHAVVASAILDAAYGLAQGFDAYDSELVAGTDRFVALSELQRRGSEVARLAIAWLDTRPRSPWFLWVHLFDPHLPYDAPDVFARRHPGRPYDAEVAAADEALGRLIARVDRGSTVVVVTADHGEALGEHREADHGYFVYDATLRVPLIVAGPGIRPGVVREQVRSVDVAPTLEALAGLPPRADLDGVSLVPLLQGGRRAAVPVSYAESWYPRLHFGWSELRAIRVGEWKYIAAPKPELYDLRTDRAELSNLVTERPAVASRLQTELAALVRDVEGTAPAPPAAQPDPETVERLRALGYIGVLAPPAGGGTADDPKDRLLDYRAYRQRLNQALGALEAGRPAQARSVLQALVKRHVRAFEAHLYLGHAYAAEGHAAAALAAYDAAATLNPSWAMPHFEAAKILIGQGQLAAAIARCRQGLALEPQAFYGLYTSGVVFQKAGLLADAADLFRRAVARNGRDPRARANLAAVSLRLGALDAAAEQFSALIAMKVQVAPSHYNLGVIALERGDRAEAARRFRLALEADPSFAPAREALGRIIK
jgi:choline-sulfatase